MRKSNNLFVQILLSSCAALVAAININTFVNAGSLVPGGFSGLSLFLVRVGDHFGVTLNYSLLYLAFNVPFVLLVLKATGWRFTLVSLIDVILTSLLVEIIPTVQLTDDPLLIAVFGGIVGGISAFLVLSADACGGGTDFISIYFAKKKNRSVWNEMLIVNALIILASGFMFGWEASLYSIIYQFVNTQIVNMADTRYHRNTVIVVTSKADDVNRAITEKFHRGVTILDGVGGFTKEERKIIYSVCGEYEIDEFTDMIHQVDDSAFINILPSQKVMGNFHEKPY